MSMNIHVSHSDVGVKMYDGPIPTPCVIYRRVMDQATKEGDEYIFNADPGTGIMGLEGSTITFLHNQDKLPDGRTKKFPHWTVNDKVVDTSKNPQVEFVGKTTVTYKPTKEDVFMTVIVEEPKVVNEEEAMDEEEVMSEQEDKKEKEEEEEAMSDEEDNKEKEEEPVKDDPNRVKHPNYFISEKKAALAQAAVEATQKAAELKAAQDKADKVAYDAISQEFKTALAGFKEQEEAIKQARHETFINMFEMVDDIAHSVIPAPANVTKDVARAKVRALDVFWANPENATIMAKLLRLTAWYGMIENDGEKNTNDKTEKYFNMWLHNFPEEGAKAQEALRVYNDSAKNPRKRTSEAAGSSSRGSKAPRGSISRTITAGLKNKGMVKKLEKEAKSNKKD